ncbi:MAG TPA: hypothetical protein VFQ61_36395, partial [Polyangiaceae bacterium]|nr:hypothetical protein [Polyangiaceae bacterium]
MKSSLVQRIEREDLVMFVNAGFACTGQREFYGDAHGQRVSIGFLHEYILGNYRRLYARCLAAGLNHFNQALIISNLLATGDHTPRSLRAEEGELLFAALNALPTQRAYRVLAGLRERKINNRRTRAVVRRYLASRGDLTFDALKYRAKLRSAVAHCHLSLPGECGKFLFECRHQRRFETPLFESYRSARYSKSALYDLPFTVAEGFAARHGVSRAGFLREIEHQMTVGEKLRQQQAAARGQLSLQMDLGRVGLTRLASYALGLSVREREAARGRLEAAFEAAARRALRRSPQRLGRVAAILDRSYSSAGSSEKRRRPLAVAWAASRILRL